MDGMAAIYLDNNSTTRVDPEVVEAMAPYWREVYANASSQHIMGQAARGAVEAAREQVAALIGAKPREIVFTSGGTESDNLAIRGVLDANPNKRHVVTTAVEHVAVLSLCSRLEQQGYRVTFVAVDSSGRLDTDAFASALDKDAALASVMHANNETGVVFPIAEIAEIAASRGVPLHCDIVQSAGKIDVDVRSMGVRLASLSAHKMHGPKGVGALYVGSGVRVRNQQVGGHQERDLRPGTEGVASIVGFGRAAELARKRVVENGRSIAELRDRLERGIVEAVTIARVNGDTGRRVSNTTNIGFEGLEAEAILIALSEAGVCVASGSACSSGSVEPSHVLAAMGIDERIANGSIRFSLSHETTDDEIERAVEIVKRTALRLSALAVPR
ncbi:MAG: aminotransferase class V-fold PLP-dependent enzyme [Planctomycetota bacterium]|nr:aminotransferase class V-fold PLP-dependent enzyme [Planctomycetota bacterium]